MRRTRLCSCLCAALGAMLLAGCGGGPSPHGTIVFSGVVNGSRGVYAVAADGTQLRRLAAGGTELAAATDGRLLAFVRGGGLWVMSPSGQGLRRIVAGPVYEYTWSPDGKQIAYRGDDLRLYVVALNGAVRRLADNGRAPVWAPDGSRVAYLTSVAHVNDEVEQEYVATVRPDGSGRQRLQLGLATGVAWSPDARRIVFAAPPEGVDDGLTVALSTMLPDGSALEVIVPDARFDLHRGSWSPNGKLLSFADGIGTWLVDPSGRHLRRISPLEYEAWSPDARWLVVHDARRLLVVAAGGGAPRLVADAAAVDSAAWLRS